MDFEQYLIEHDLVVFDRAFAERVIDIVEEIRHLYQQPLDSWYEVDDMAIDMCYTIAEEFEEKLAKQRLIDISAPTIREKLGKGFRAIKLEDDGTDHGGISHTDETLGEFLDEVGRIDGSTPFSKLEDTLVACGIRVPDGIGSPSSYSPASSLLP